MNRAQASTGDFSPKERFKMLLDETRTELEKHRSATNSVIDYSSKYKKEFIDFIRSRYDENKTKLFVPNVSEGRRRKHYNHPINREDDFIHSDQYQLFHNNQSEENLLGFIKGHLKRQLISGIVIHHHSTNDMCELCAPSLAIDYSCEEGMGDKFSQLIKKHNEDILFEFRVDSLKKTINNSSKECPALKMDLIFFLTTSYDFDSEAISSSTIDLCLRKYEICRSSNDVEILLKIFMNIFSIQTLIQTGMHGFTSFNPLDFYKQLYNQHSDSPFVNIIVSSRCEYKGHNHTPEFPTRRYMNIDREEDVNLVYLWNKRYIIQWAIPPHMIVKESPPQYVPGEPLEDEENLDLPF